MPTSSAPLWLALDTGSPVVSVALSHGESVSTMTLEQARSSERLLASVEELLQNAQASVGDLDGIVAARGPGSFTGLRVGLSTALGLHQALSIPATAVPTLRALAACVEPPRPVVAAVDALRGEWFVQRFNKERKPEAGSRLVAGQELAQEAPPDVVGFGVEGLSLPPSTTVHEPPPLAPALLVLAGELETWDAELLTQPLYLRPAAAQPLG